jgi:hypothetical protein
MQTKILKIVMLFSPSRVWQTTHHTYLKVDINITSLFLRNKMTF